MDISNILKQQSEIKFPDFEDIGEQQRKLREAVFGEKNKEQPKDIVGKLYDSDGFYINVTQRPQDQIPEKKYDDPLGEIIAQTLKPEKEHYTAKKEIRPTSAVQRLNPIIGNNNDNTKEYNKPHPQEVDFSTLCRYYENKWGI